MQSSSPPATKEMSHSTPWLKEPQKKTGPYAAHIEVIAVSGPAFSQMIFHKEAKQWNLLYACVELYLPNCILSPTPQELVTLFGR